jgi:hypothetical protein
VTIVFNHIFNAVLRALPSSTSVDIFEPRLVAERDAWTEKERDATIQIATVLLGVEL